MKTRYPVPAPYQVGVTLVVSILSGLSAGVAPPLSFFGHWPLAMFLTPIAMISAVILLARLPRGALAAATRFHTIKPRFIM